MPQTSVSTVAVTGAFSYSGRFIAASLLRRGQRVITLTNKPRPPIDPFEGCVDVAPLHFDMTTLTRSLEGVKTLVNTYWVRFNHGRFTFETAVHNTGILFEAAVRAGVRRIVHVSIANPSLDSPFAYYRGKARIEAMLASTGIEQMILRPAVIFGLGDILVNNIAWALRHLPLFGYFGDGCYRMRPIHVSDFAELAARAAVEPQSEGRVVLDAVGPEVYAYRELVRMIGRAIGYDRLQCRVPKLFGYLTATLIGWWHRDIFLTWDEIGGLMADLLTTDGPTTGSTCLSDWVAEHRDILGRAYASELARRC